MTEMSKGFNADSFDDMCREALDQNDDVMAPVYAVSGIKRALRPGELGGVEATPTLVDVVELTGTSSAE